MNPFSLNSGVFDIPRPFGEDPSGESIIAEYVIDLGDIKIATVDGEAMFFDNSGTVDFGALYAGTDLGSTPYRFVFTDSTGKEAIAWGGAVGGGEALSAELIVSLMNASGLYVYETLTINANNHDIDSAINTADGGIVYTTNILSVGKLYQLNVNLTVNSGETPRVGTHRGDSAPANYIYGSFTGSMQFVFTSYLATYSDVGIRISNSVGGISNWSALLSCKAYTDVPATGLHLMSEQNGTTRNLASIETGFIPAAITGVTIYG